MRKKYKLKPLFKHQVIITVVLVFLLVISLIGGSFALFSKSTKSDEYNLLKVGDIELSYVDLSDEGNVLGLNNPYPVSDEVGSIGTSYRFSVENVGSVTTTYNVVIKDDVSVINADGCAANQLNKENIRYKLDNGEVGTLSDLYNEDFEGYVIYSGTLVKDDTDIHEIRLWLKEDSPNDVLGAHYHGKVSIMMEQDIYKDKSGAARPVLTDNLIPVTIDDNGTVKRADLSEKWYDYDNKEWANAVILENKQDDYKYGDVIPEENIQSYFVWIPKYRYKLWNVETTNEEVGKHSIDIVFDKNNTTDTDTSCVTPMTSGATGNCSNGKYMTHPAFISLDVDGIWVGKFELGYKGATTTNTAQVSSNDSTKIIVKPNVYSWRNNTVENFFNAMYNYNREMDSHMMKNTEWGAVAYLSHSKYGIDNEVNINNNSAFLTGYSAKITTNQGTYPGEYGDGGIYNDTYNTETGYLASTTGNISGIYDMAGGAYEYMASYRSGASIPQGDAKYFDVYSSSSSSNSYNYRILGDATGEMGPIINYKDGDSNSRWHNKWYGDYSEFVDSTYPWIHRGGRYDNGVLAGQFHFGRYGAASGNIGSRLVLAAK